MTPLNHLHQLALEDNRKKYPSFPDAYRPKPKYSDTTEKGLKKCIVDFCTFTGHHAEPINNRGFVVDERQVVENVIGQLKTIGSKKWIKSTQEKGTADMQARFKRADLPFAIPVAIEIKMPGDRQSQDQKRYQAKVESAGGLYWIVTSFDDFYVKYLQLMEK